MNVRDLPTRLVQALFLIALLSAASVKPLKGQQVADSARVAPARSVPASSTIPSTLGPRQSPQFQRVDTRLAPSNSESPRPLAVAAGQHTIVISTLALVLATIIIVLLVVN